jgi:hypothetical protein
VKLKIKINLTKGSKKNIKRMMTKLKKKSISQIGIEE